MRKFSQTSKTKRARYFRHNKTHKMIVKVERVMKRSEIKSDRELANEIGMFFIRNGFLTAELKTQAKNLIKKYPEETKAVVKKGRHYLYALSDGEHVKIGFTIDIESRQKRIQTGHPKRLKLVWHIYCAEDSKEAKRQETELHRAIKRHHVRGEWFKIDALKQVKDWRVINREVRQEQKGIRENELLDEQFRQALLTSK